MKRVVAALIFQDDKILVCQRTRHQTMPLKWEFPGGKIEEGEQPRDALHRELEEELGIDAKIGQEVSRIVHEYPGGGSVELRFFRGERIQRNDRKQNFSRSALVAALGIIAIRFSRSRPDSGAGFGGWETYLARSVTRILNGFDVLTAKYCLGV